MPYFQLKSCHTVALAIVLIALSGCRPEASPVLGVSQGESDEVTLAVGSPVEEPAESLGLAEIQWPAKIKPEELRASVKGGIDYLVRTTNEQGKFAYIVNTDPEVPPTDEYNVVRHAGTMYGLGMYLERYQADNELVRETLKRHGAFLRKQIEPVEGEEEMLAIWSDPSVTGLEGPRRAELGSAALGLIGLSCVEREAPGSIPPEELTGLANFIRFMQKDDGDFYARHIPDEGGKLYVPKLLFYPGESALALVLLYEVDGNERWLEAAAKSIAFMSQQRDAHNNPPLDHWMLLATSRIWPVYDKTSQPVSRQHLVRYSVDLCERLMVRSIRRLDDERLKGCITGNGFTCPTATRVEGLVAALNYLPQDQLVFRTRVQRVAEDALVFLVNSQVSQGKYRGGIPYAMFRLPDDHPWQQNDYNKMQGEIRIDYVHHAISGMMLYDDVVLRK